jgi:tryptophanyl-tRNA synthetase
VRTAFTDPQRTKRNIPGRPDICNVYALHKIFNPGDVDAVHDECTTAARGCVDCKLQLAAGINRSLEALRDRRRDLEAHPGYVDDVLEEGARKAKAIGRETIVEVMGKMGL